MLAALVLVLAAGDISNEPDLTAYWSELEELQHRYELELVKTFADRLRLQVPKPSAQEEVRLFVETYTTICEFARIEYEELDEAERDARQFYGDTIDEAARNGLELCKQLDRTSERYTYEAALIGATIRTKFRAKRYRRAMENAADEAIALDPDNPDAYTIRAIPYLMADDRHGGDLQHAVELLNQALVLEPNNEHARLLLAHAHEEMGELDLATDEYRDLLARNSNCVPAKRALDRLNADEC